MNNIQQGDVLIRRVNEIPEKAKVESKDSIILALGETTGHFHGIDCIGAEILDHAGTRYIKLPTSAILKHQEHNPIEIPAGLYQIGIVQEYDYFSKMTRKVVD